jgi:hypothetical protein
LPFLISFYRFFLDKANLDQDLDMIAGASFETMLVVPLNSIQNAHSFVSIFFSDLKAALRCYLWS